MAFNPISALFGLFSHDIGIDLGTANTLVMVKGRGIVIDEPSVVAIDRFSKRILAIGAEAKRMVGRTPGNIVAIRPLKDGVIADFEVTEAMLRYFIRKVLNSRRAHPRVVMCAPSGVTDVEKRAVEEACLSAGARQMTLIEEPIAAAIGAGLAIAEPTGQMVVDVGGGTSEVAVISLGGIVVSASARVGGYDFDEAINAHLRAVHGIATGTEAAERLKIEIGSAWPLEQELAAELRGRDLVSGLPKTVVTTTEEIREALEEPVTAIVDAVKVTLDKTPPELAADVMERGIVLTGGGALLLGMRERLEAETGMPVVMADDPLLSVAVGSGRSLEAFEALRGVLFSASKPLMS